jgi:hypothetical protein
MERYIRFFRKDNEEFAGEISINIDDSILEKKNVKEYDPMLIYSYPINPEDVCLFLQFLENFQFDFFQFDYFLEYS